MNTYIGREIGETDYIRNRELEFSLKHIPKADLLKNIDETILVIDSALNKITQEDLIKEYPVVVFDTPTSTEHLLLHLSTHLSYHLGQINYHRRLLDI